MSPRTFRVSFVEYKALLPFPPPPLFTTPPNVSHELYQENCDALLSLSPFCIPCQRNKKKDKYLSPLIQGKGTLP